MTVTRSERHLPRTREVGLGRDFFDAFLPDRLRGLLPGDLGDTAFDRLDRAFDRAFERTGEDGVRLMRIEEFADGDHSVIRAELPGIDPEKDVEISVTDGVLRLSAVREERTDEERPEGYRSEFRYGTLVRSFRLPDGVSEDDVTATYKDGILEVRVPTPPAAEPPTPRRIPVARG